MKSGKWHRESEDLDSEYSWQTVNSWIDKTATIKDNKHRRCGRYSLEIRPYLAPQNKR